MKKNNTTLLLIVLFVTISFMLIGFTFAYFIVQGNKETNAAINATTYTTDSLTFEVGKDIAFSLNQLNLAPGGENQSGETSAKATLIANNKTNEATSSYYVYLNITNNEFIYTTDNNTPELILSITDPSGKNVTSITGLTYGTYNGVSGFDITTKTGLIKIAEKYQINASPKTVQEWKVKVTFVNLDSDQGANSEKVAEAKILIQENEIKYNTISEACTGQNMAECFYEYSDLDTNLYLHDTNLTNGANDGNLRYSGADYIITSKAIDAGYSHLGNTAASAKNGIINFFCNGSANYVLGQVCSKTNTYYYTLSYDAENVQYNSYRDVLDKAIEDGYVMDNSINNYVCFGYDSIDGTCPTDNLYRIIGIFDNKIKLIKYDYVTKDMLGQNGEYCSNNQTSSSYFYSSHLEDNEVNYPNTYYWNYSENSNDWSKSKLNLINLNTNFFNFLGTSWTNKIFDAQWTVSGVNESTSGYNRTSYSIFKNEIINSSSTFGPSKIALLNLSDYTYSRLPASWKNSDHDGRESWIYQGYDEFLLTPISTTSKRIKIISVKGTLDEYGLAKSSYPIRPVFYLKSDVKLISGKGTMTNPYRVQ